MVSVHVNPLDSNLVMSAGNDHTARIFDLRLLTSSEPPAAAVKGAFELPSTTDYWHAHLDAVSVPTEED